MEAMRVASTTAVLMVALIIGALGWNAGAAARSVVGNEDKDCADTANAEAAIAACTRLYDNRGLGLRNRAIALGNRGAAFKMLGRYDEAIADFGRAIELDGGNPQYYCQRGDLRVRKGANDDAIADYTTALQKSPGYLWAYRGRGQAYLAQGNGPLALADLNQALRLKPGNFGLLVLRGRANNFAKSYDAAIADLTQALADKSVSSLLPKERANILAQRGFAFVKQERVPEAKTDIDEALRLAPKVAFALGVSGLIQEKQGQKAEAKDSFTRALAIEPNLTIAKLGLERVNQSNAATTTREPPEPLAQSEPPAHVPPEPAVEPEPTHEPQPGSDLCARYIPEVGKTVRVKCGG
jgi:tetratricopeptide (TPR) repeat protein